MLLIALLVLSIVFIVIATAKLKLHPFLALLAAAFGFGICANMPLKDVVSSVNTGFGNTVGAIGIVILAGSIIGSFLEQSGGALRLAERALRITGEKNTPLAMALVGYVVSIPVFCDSAFVLLSPINKALARKANVSLAAGAIALSLGLYSTHTMVPPTPGPVGAAGVLNADLGLVILWGGIVGLFATFAGWTFAVKVAGRLDLRPEVEEPADMRKGHDDLPSTAKSLTPILLPIILILVRSIAELPSNPLGVGRLTDVIVFLGQPIVSLLIGALFAFLLPKPFDRKLLSTDGLVGKAIVSASSIIVITGAGGAFGKVLQNSGIADVIGTGFQGHEGIGILLPLLVAAGLKTAQGSSTVAMITTAGLVAPLLPALGLDGEAGKALTVVAIGAGGMLVSHANDSYFWVVTQFSGMTLSQGYRLQTLGTLVEGLAAAVVIWFLAMVVV
ncbi:MAG: GntP family permease, partial [Candidatus Hydrogenedentes bacterium]|nr:GntP family permease [Candidatus Hydrogenedentota bacterium]